MMIRKVEQKSGLKEKGCVAGSCRLEEKIVYGDFAFTRCSVFETPKISPQRGKLGMIHFRVNNYYCIFETPPGICSIINGIMTLAQ